MYTILHNSRCGKSRDAVKLLEESGVDYQIREYLKDELSFDELKQIISHLGLEPFAVVRTGEQIWKDEFKEKIFTSDELIQLMVENPKLIQRPIVLKDGKGVIGRPLESIVDFIK